MGDSRYLSMHACIVRCQQWRVLAVLLHIRHIRSAETVLPANEWRFWNISVSEAQESCAFHSEQRLQRVQIGIGRLSIAWLTSRTQKGR